jgi:hypothetical protein
MWRRMKWSLGIFAEDLTCEFCTLRETKVEGRVVINLGWYDSWLPNPWMNKNIRQLQLCTGKCAYTGRLSY